MSLLQNFVISMPIRSSGYDRSAKLFAQQTNVRFAPIVDVQIRRKALTACRITGKFLQGISQCSGHRKVRGVVGIQLFDVGD